MKTLYERIASFQALMPQSAKLADIEEGERLLKEISPEDEDTKVTLLIKLGSLYLETQEIDAERSVEYAKNRYEAAMTIARDSNNVKWMIYGLSGYTNVLIKQYDLFRDPDDLNAAESNFDNLIDFCDKLEMKEEANSNRINYANLLIKSTQGDRFTHINKAITLLRRVLSDSSQEVLGESFNPNVYARRLYNLGVALLKQDEEPHLRSLCLNEAIDNFKLALEYRPADRDPAGRARILRTLALVLPEWVGAESPEHAEQLADEALQEADALEANDVIPEKAAWAKFKQDQSALYWDVDIVAQNRAGLETAIARHQSNIQQIPRETLPYLWSEWVGGYARLVGRLGVEDNNPELWNKSQSAFLIALEAISENHDPRLCLILYRELGRVYHECGDWEGSFNANNRAAEIGLTLTDIAGTAASRTNELESFTRSIHFAAYAAVQLGRLPEAAELAEIGRAVWLDEAIRLASIRISSLPLEFKDAVDQAQAALLELERQEHELLNKGIGGAALRLEDYLGIPIGDGVKIRSADDPDGSEAQLRADLSQVRERLQQAHSNLGALLNSIPDGYILPKRPSVDQIKTIAARSGLTLVYLLSCVWGSTAIIVGEGVESLDIPGLNRKRIQDLLYGDTGYLRLCSDTSHENFETSLQAMQQLLDENLIPPFTRWCKDHGVTSVGIIGLGDVGLLPIQVSTVPADLTIHILPSARSLTLTSTQIRESDPSKVKLLAISGVISNGLRPLAFSRPESLFFSGTYRKAGARVSELTLDVTLENVGTNIEGSTHLLFSCHGNFAAFSPLNSVIYLEGGEVLPVETLLRPSLRLASTQLVILSACNSGSTEYWRTPDEAIGFPAAFLAAGARTIIAAQWKVSEAATFLLMQQLCTELLHSGFDAAKSLANAQRWLRNLTTPDVEKAISQIVEVMGENESRTKRMLRELRENIVSLRVEYPFHARKFWGAFICVGA
jgi:CHAT domain-containing protein/tetratricopeptide (TPR) repeat protein